MPPCWSLSGVANALAQYLWTRALHLAPTTAVSPFYYLLLVWALVIGFLAWGDVPTFGLLAGSAIVVASGLFLLWHETGRVIPGMRPQPSKLPAFSPPTMRQSRPEPSPPAPAR